ncbi:hypothetical protein OAT76_03550 [Flavobacteriaceae bacterium]|jgi:hypothetical protein|nr:hypothetical protein [Flavobacteriaceae bacterium]
MNPSDTSTKPNWDGVFYRLREDYELFYDDDGRASQFRLHLKDEDPEIKNKCICVSRIHFKKPVNLFYERHKTIGNKKIIEYYYNDSLDTYSETTTIHAIEVTRFFTADGFLFSIDKTYLDNSGKVKSAYRYLQNDKGRLQCFEVDDGSDDNN